jgi:hypothetical protein
MATDFRYWFDRSAPLAVSLVSTRDGQLSSPQLSVVSGNLLGFFAASTSSFPLAGLSLWRIW